MKKRIIWSNLNLDPKDWIEDYKSFIEDNGEEVPEVIDDNAVYDWAVETNSSYLDDEKANLDHILDGRVLLIADLGLWNGRKQGYRILGKNLNQIFNINPRGFDYAEFYGDGFNVRATEEHHDGTNHYEFRMIREDRDIERLLADIYEGKEISRQRLNYYTKSLYKEVAKIYGWR